MDCEKPIFSKKSNQIVQFGTYTGSHRIILVPMWPSSQKELSTPALVCHILFEWTQNARLKRMSQLSFIWVAIVCKNAVKNCLFFTRTKLMINCAQLRHKSIWIFVSSYEYMWNVNSEVKFGQIQHFDQIYSNMIIIGRKFDQLWHIFC